MSPPSLKEHLRYLNPNNIPTGCSYPSYLKNINRKANKRKPTQKTDTLHPLSPTYPTILSCQKSQEKALQPPQMNRKTINPNTSNLPPTSLRAFAASGVFPLSMDWAHLQSLGLFELPELQKELEKLRRLGESFGVASGTERLEGLGGFWALLALHVLFLNLKGWLRGL